jgi:hypothetical protein
VDEAVRSVLGEVAPEAGPRNQGGEVFPERLFSLRHAEALARGVREVKVAPGTVITPLAFQALKQQGVVLRFGSKSEVDRVKRNGTWGFAIEVESGVVAALRRALLDGPESWVEVAGFDALTRWLVSAADRGAMLLTEEASVAVWRACQVAGIRASAAESCDAVDRAVRRLGVNLVVVEPAGKSVSQMKQMGLTLCRGGAPRAPGELSKG